MASGNESAVITPIEATDDDDDDDDVVWELPVTVASYYHPTHPSFDLSEDKVKLMIQAAKDGNVEILQDILEHDPSYVNVKFIYGVTDDSTLLHVSARKGQVGVMKLLLDCNADVHAVDEIGNTPLDHAALNGMFDAVKVLIERGADIHITNNNGQTPLHRVSRSGDVSCIALLLDKGANINDVDNLGNTPLHYAALNGMFDAVKVLIELGADIHITNKTGQTPLHRASRSGDVSCIALLLDKGANINDVDNLGNTPLHYAALNGMFDAVKVLIELGADIHITNKTGQTPLHRASRSGDVSCIALLLDKGANINDVDNYGDTPLHYAAHNGGFNAVKVLIERRADIHITNKEGETPLLIAVSEGHSNIVKYLINQHKVDITELDQETQLKINALLEDDNLSDSALSVTEDDSENTPIESATTGELNVTSDSLDAHVIMAYEAALKEGSQSSNQFKLVTLGAEGAGKSSSVNTLLNLPFQPNQESTVGASVNSCSVDTYLASSKWQKITAAFQITQINKQHKSEVKAAMSSVTVKPVTPAPVKPIPQEVLDEVKAVMTSKEEIPQDGHIRIVIFDIGGQEVYYDVHFLFLAIEDVALLVFDCSKGLDDPVISRQRTGRFGEIISTRGMQSNIETIELLLHSVYSRGQTAPEGSISPRVPVVIMLGAHAEDVSIEDQELIIQTIYRRFDGMPFLEHLPQLKEEAFHFLANSKPDPKSVNHLRATIVKAAELVITAQRPISYLKFEGKILEKLQQAEVRLCRTDATDIAKDAGIEGEQAVDALLRYFTNKGILLYYPEVRSLKSEIFISPQEVSDLVCAVITTHDCQPHTANLQRSYCRYNQYALLEEPLLNFILLQSKRSKDKEVLLGLLDKFNLATEVPSNTKFSHEIGKPGSNTSKVFIVPPLLVYDDMVPYHKQDGDIVIQYYFPDGFLLESVFNQLLVKTIQWCCKHKHIIRCIRRGVGYFSFKNAHLQQFQLQLCQSISSINCYITIQSFHQSPSDMLPVLLQQRRQLLAYLETYIVEVSKCCMPSAEPPVTCLECPLHEEDCIPHVPLDINNREVLVCHERGVLVTPLPEKSYILLYNSDWPDAIATATKGSLSTALLAQKPKMSVLVRVVIPKIAAHWSTLAYLLELNIPTVGIIKKQYPNNPVESCTEVFVHWLNSDEGTHPKTWAVLLKKLKDVAELTAVTEQIEIELSQYS